MIKDIAVSIIIPSLNTADYIAEALSSAILQELRDIEIICVDAGSTDGTLNIIDEQVRADSRVVLLHSDRKSYGYQMNIGIDAARGEYIGILEADDLVPPEMYGDLYEIAREKRLDIVKADFHRFTGTGDGMKKIYFSLTDRWDLYRRVFEPAKEQGSMLTTNNTWCGIYRREFLLNNRIRHNESPGASFQDNGFYFQTMMFAKRVYFLNMPYYMNRRDNPGSSVFDKRKAYCICDEYDFIYDMIKSAGLSDVYRDTYAIRRFMEYYGNLGRLDSSDKRDFMRRFCDDFRKMEKNGELDISLFDEWKASQLSAIMQDPDAYWADNIKPYDDVYDEAEKYENIIIYGAASIGWQALHAFLGRGKGKNILCFAVTRPKPGVSEVYGYDVKAIDLLSDLRGRAVVVIASKMKYQQEMQEKAEKLGFRHILKVPCRE